MEPPEEPLFTQQETLTEEEVIAHCKESLPAYKIPRLVESRQELPKSMVGKVLRKELRAEESSTIGGGAIRERLILKIDKFSFWTYRFCN
jgi:acyl-CoA synthetase (AMP-forming)/AMP-acid ligase II